MKSRDLSSAAQFSDNPALTGDIRTCPILVCCGRGLGDDEGFSLACELARAVGAQITGTRAALDAGWITHERELGLSGARVSPRLYIGCGVSGTNFHTIGMKSSDLIIAVNTDPLARIFSLADICILREIKPVLRELINELARHPVPADTEKTIMYLREYFLQRENFHPHRA